MLMSGTNIETMYKSREDVTSFTNKTRTRSKRPVANISLTRSINYAVPLTTLLARLFRISPARFSTHLKVLACSRITT